MKVEEMCANADETAEFLKAMAHPDPLMVLCQLTQGELDFTKLLQTSCLSQSAFSQ